MSTQAISSNEYTAKEIKALVNKKIIATIGYLAYSVLMLTTQVVLVHNFFKFKAIYFIAVNNTIVRTIFAGALSFIIISDGINYSFKALANFFNLVGYWTTNNVELLTMKN